MKYLGVLIIYLFINAAAGAAGESLVVKKASKEVLLTGFTRSIRSQAVSSEISGKVLKVNYDVGDTVGNEPFIEIDPTFIGFQIKSTVLDLERSEISIRKSRSRVAYLEKEASRIEELLSQDMTTESGRDKIVQDLEQAKLELDLALEEKSVLTVKLEELREQRARHIIYVPEGWVVTERSVEVNEYVQPGASLAVVSDYRELIVPLHVSSEELSAIKSFPEIFEVELEGEEAQASVNWINPEFDEKTRKLNIELIIKNYRSSRRGGLKLTVPVRIAAEGLHVPKAAVITRYENPIVILKHTGDTVRLLVLGDAQEYLHVADDEKLSPGVELIPQGSVQVNESK